MQRIPVNPWSWSQKVGYNQGEILEGAKRQLICAGQTAVDSEGNPQHFEDMRSQINLTLDNLEAVLNDADMGFDNVTRLNIYTTDVDQAMQHFDLLGCRFGPVRWRYRGRSSGPSDADPGVDEPVNEVGEQVGHDDHGRREDHDAEQ